MKTEPGTVITVEGEPVFGLYCPVCLEDWRMRLTLAVNGVMAGGLEICPGCGTGHDKPGYYLTPPPDDRLAALLAAPDPGRGVFAWLRRRLENPGCAYRDCPWAGRRRWAHEMHGDEGRWTFLFCRKSHRAKWAAENGVIL